MEKRRRTRLIISAAPLIFLLIVLPFLFADIFEGILVPFDQWTENRRNLKKADEEQRQFKSLFSKLVKGKDRRNLEISGFACDVSENSIVCLANHEVKIDTTNNITVYDSNLQQKETKVKPYALQKDEYLLQFITSVKIRHQKAKPPVCQYNHNVPAVIFSSGISRNLFHEFNDILIPLFITIKHFQSRVQLILEDYDPTDFFLPFELISIILLVALIGAIAIARQYSKIFSRLSSHELMNPSANRSMHCFPGMILGLKYHDNLALKPSDIPGGHTMHGFREFLRETYDLTYRHVSQIRKPKLMLISREKTRRFLNEDEMIAMMKELGFHVVVAKTKEATNLNEFANIVNSCSVLVGAHGAGLTNELFLPAGAVMVQVEPLGLEWAAANYYGDPARAMGIHYLRYKIEPEESSLLKLYGPNHAFIADPASVYAKGYGLVKAVYLQQQDIRVNIVKFRETLVKALQLVGN